MAKVIKSSNSEETFRKRSVAGIRLFISESSMNTMIDHAHCSPEREVMGLMIGNVFRDGAGPYATVERTATSELIADDTSVRFSKDSLEDLFNAIDDSGDQVVTGWYHSHLGIGCFMSDTDTKTHSGIFGSECGFALVIDPMRREIKAFGTPDSKEEMFVIMED